MATTWHMLATEQACHDIPMQEVKREQSGRDEGVAVKDGGSFLFRGSAGAEIPLNEPLRPEISFPPNKIANKR